MSQETNIYRLAAFTFETSALRKGIKMNKQEMKDKADLFTLSIKETIANTSSEIIGINTQTSSKVLTLSIPEKIITITVKNGNLWLTGESWSKTTTNIYHYNTTKNRLIKVAESKSRVPSKAIIIDNHFFLLSEQGGSESRQSSVEIYAIEEECDLSHQKTITLDPGHYLKESSIVTPTQKNEIHILAQNLSNRTTKITSILYVIDTQTLELKTKFILNKLCGHVTAIAAAQA